MTMLAPEYQGACLPWERKRRAGAEPGVWIGLGIAAAALIGAAVAVIRSRRYCSFVATAKGGVRDRRIGFLGFRQRNETNGQSSSLMA
ncbi:hypothetical protein [Streptomyces sp900116325]|uniref:hypothetical protein n=1 Tax=Streptomyces sp. 900116325 TaxID=3154295 RepID=UPI0033AFF67C